MLVPKLQYQLYDKQYQKLSGNNEGHCLIVLNTSVAMNSTVDTVTLYIFGMQYLYRIIDTILV